MVMRIEGLVLMTTPSIGCANSQKEVVENVGKTIYNVIRLRKKEQGGLRLLFVSATEILESVSYIYVDCTQGETRC